MSYKNNLRVIMKTLKICEGNSKGNKFFLTYLLKLYSL